MRQLPILLVLLIGALLRIHALTQDMRLHPDEALFATFARSAALNGAWTLPGELDKPPLSIYGVALAMQFLAARGSMQTLLDFDAHSGEFAARVPGVFYSLLLIAVIYALALRLYRDRRVALLAAGLLALSPYAVAFGATVFTDGLMLLCMLIALWQAARGAPLWSGFWLALGLASKQQAVLVAPLVIIFLFNAEVQTAFDLQRRRESNLFVLLRFVLPVVMFGMLMVLWQSQRAAWPDLWTLAAANNAPDRLLIAGDELVPRLARWLGLMGEFAGWLTLPLTLIGVWGVIISPILQTNHEARSKRLYDWLLVLYLIGFTGFHWLTAINMYDRYPFPLLPLWALVVARGVQRLLSGMPKGVQLNAPTQADNRSALTSESILHRESLRPSPTKFLFLIRKGRSKTRPQNLDRLIFVPLCLCVFVLGFFAFNASEGRISVGGDRGMHANIDQFADWLNALPLGTIIYDRWLGWELGYYMGQWTDKRRVYYPTPELLVEGALEQPDPAPRYFIAPVRFVAPPEQPPEVWLAALDAAGFQPILIYETADYRAWRLIPPRRQP